MSYRDIKIELLDHADGGKENLTLGAFLDANDADEELFIEAYAMVISLEPGQSWRFAPGIGDDYEIRRVP